MSARILVVEDEPLVRELMVEVLAEAGFQVDEAEDGEQALKLIDADGYALLLTDINLPGRDSIQIAAHARRKRPDLPIILVSGRPEAIQQARLVGSGSAVLAKPYSSSILVRTVRTALQ